MFRFLCLVMRIFRRTRHDINRHGQPYLTRFELLGERFGKGSRLLGGGKLYLHYFHDSDPEDMHDHPWPYWSLILWRGYYEVTPHGRKWYGPLSLLRQPAVHRHRVELRAGKPCATLFWIGKQERSWYFYCGEKQVHYKEYASRAESSKSSGCP